MEVNNGKGTKIWIHKWIIGLDIKVEPLHPSHLQYVFVSELIFTDTNSWNTSLLNMLFIPEIVEKIQNMQLSVHEEDCMKWLPARDGNFSVKTAYNKLMEVKVQQQIALNVVPTAVWKSLWKMKLPHRVKIFIWKSIKGIVPTRMRLAQAMHIIETHCEIGKHDEETLYHLPIKCPHAKAVWRTLNINTDQISVNCQSVRDWIISWFQDMQNTGAEDMQRWRELLMVGCWIIWKERCDCVFQDKTLNHIHTANRIQYQLINFNSSLHTSLSDSITSETRDAYHDRIAHNHMLNNLSESMDAFQVFKDAFFDGVSNECGTGVVLLNLAGECTGIKGTHAAGVVDAEMGEFMAIMEGL
ncbi:uncharacterized protein LOC113272568 [Papaver somniferum]|uniref:uncharacterized protein LOC113272568 n=1 Tax=Papaver somniferum TaxID=3469 RepID=UPI000E703A4C|nr:uncharacterized protein LOC113272568 [Papaver somniferum]